jgi:hypothetical protein
LFVHGCLVGVHPKLEGLAGGSSTCGSKQQASALCAVACSTDDFPAMIARPEFMTVGVRMAPGDMSKETVARSTKVIRWLGAIAVVGTAAAIAVYAAFFGRMSIVPDPAAWGLLGDFVGGLLTPMIGLLFLVGLGWGLEQLRQELRAIRCVLERASLAPGTVRSTGGVSSGVTAGLQRTIELIHQDLKEQLSVGVGVVRGADSLALGEPGGKVLSLAQLLRDSAQDPVLREALAKECRSALLQVAELLGMLARYIHEYEASPEGRSCAGYLRRRHALYALALLKLGLLPDKVAVYYRDYKTSRTRAGSAA